MARFHIKGVVFDLDGTLTRFNLDYRTVRAEVRNYLMTRHVPPTILALNESIFKMLRKVEIFLKNQGKPREVAQKIQKEVLAMVEKYEWEAAKSTGVLPGVRETLSKIKERGLKMGLCTINSEKSANHILKRFGLTDFFDVVVPRNSVRYVKPNAEHMDAALKELGVDPEEVIVVGDGGSDMKCAKTLGAIAVGLPTGVSSVEGLINCGAQYIVTSITDLPRLIDEI